MDHCGNVRIYELRNVYDRRSTRIIYLLYVRALA